MRTEWPLNRFNCVFGSSIKSSITLVKTWKVGVVKGMEAPHPHPWCSTSAICLKMNSELKLLCLRHFLRHNRPFWHQFLSVFVHCKDAFSQHQKRNEIGS